MKLKRIRVRLALGAMLSVSFSGTHFSLADVPAAQPATTKVEAFNPIVDDIRATSNSWVLWSHLKDSSRKKALPRNNAQYIAQALDQDRLPVLVAEQDTAFYGPLAMLPDGSMCAATKSGLTRFKAGQPAASDGQSFPGLVQALYPDGVLMISDDGGSHIMHPFAAVYWVSIHDHRLDLQSLVHWDMAMDWRGGLSFRRHGDEIAWLDVTDVKDLNGEPPHKPTLRIATVSTRAVRSVELPADQFRIGGALLGFDGINAFDGTRVIDVKTGKTATLTEPIKALGLLDAVIFSVHETDKVFELVGTPVSDVHAARTLHTTEKSLLFGSNEPIGYLGGAKDNIYFVAEKAVHAWNGKKWITVPTGK